MGPTAGLEGGGKFRPHRDSIHLVRDAVLTRLYSPSSPYIVRRKNSIYFQYADSNFDMLRIYTGCDMDWISDRNLSLEVRN